MHHLFAETDLLAKHFVICRKELIENKRGLAEVWRVLREIQDEQRQQGEERRQVARKFRQLRTTVHGHQGDTLERPAGESEQRNPTQRRPESGQADVTKAPCMMKSDEVQIVKIPFPNQVRVVKKLAPLPYQLADMAVVPHHDGNLILLRGYNLKPCLKLPSMLEKR